MRFFRHYKSVLIFAAFLVFCSVMVIRQINFNQAKHAELREAFILLYTKGYQKEAERLYEKLLPQLDSLPSRQLLDDFQRTLTLVNPRQQQSEDLIWKYHWIVSKKIEEQSWATLDRALKLAEEK